MNKKEVIGRIAIESGVKESECLKVVNSLEEVIGQEIANSNGWNKVFEKVYSIMTNIYNKKQNKTKQEKNS